MPLLLLLAVRCVWLSWVCAMHYPASWGHYDVCKSQVYTEDGLVWHYMACQPEATDMTKYLRVTLDPPNITCGDPPEMYCALAEHISKVPRRRLDMFCISSVWFEAEE
ncbi:netrin-G1-like [Hoplias malabaricus]|uniref:netrin-G1-like n=1 Tax=Hoplias malabaricus TaxID=27720 RepID=UPI003463471E